MWGLQPGRGARLALETAELQLWIDAGLGAELTRRDELYRRGTDEHAVPCSPHLAHAAAADLLFKCVLTDLGGILDLLS